MARLLKTPCESYPMTFDPCGDAKDRSAKMVEAARAGNASEIAKHTSEGADISVQRPESGDTALLAAINTDQFATSAYLLKQHPTLSLRNNNRNAPRYLTVIRGDSAAAMVQMHPDAGALADLRPKKEVAVTGVRREHFCGGRRREVASASRRPDQALVPVESGPHSLSVMVVLDKQIGIAVPHCCVATIWGKP